MADFFSPLYRELLLIRIWFAFYRPVTGIRMYVLYIHTYLMIPNMKH